MSSQVPVWLQPGDGYKFKRSWTYLPRILPYLRKYWRLGASSVTLMVASAALAVAQPWPLAILVDSVLAKHPVEHFLTGLWSGNKTALLYLAVGAALAIAVLINGLGVLSEYVNTKLHQKMALDFRGDLFRHAERLPLSFHDQTRRDMLVGRFVFETSAMGSITVSMPAIAQSVITLVGMILITFTLDPVIALIAISVLPFIYYSITYYAIHIEPEVRRVKFLEWRGLGVILEALTMLRVIFSFGREHHEYKRFREVSESAVDARVKLTVRQTLFSFVVNVTTALGTAAVMVVGAYHVLHGRLSIGQLLVVMGYIAAVYDPLHTISAAFTSLQDDVVALGLAFELLDTVPEIEDAPGAVAIDRAEGAVAFRDVSFGYANRRTTLEDISFEVNAGGTIAIVGPTGAGKSTLVSLIPRLYDAESGTILLDGRDIRELTLESLRRQVAVVLQEPMLFSGTVADNIRYGRLDATEEEIVEATKAANAHDFVTALPKGYDTELGEAGVRLSGGERQRLCIARAFLKDAPILILDEPTSSIDSRTETAILEALDRLMIGRTTFIIAHRLSTIRNAERILVLDRGRIVQSGTHDELVKSGGLFRELSDTQRGPARPSGEDPPPIDTPPAGSGSSSPAEPPVVVPAPVMTATSIASPAGTPSVSGSKKVVLLGMMSKMPVAGVVWQTLHYLEGLRRLGYEVFYVEAHARTPSAFMTDAEGDGSSRAADFIASVMQRVDLTDHWAFHALHADGRCFGMSESRLNDLYGSAEILINLHGGTEPLPEHSATKRLVYVETDPVQLQVELHQNSTSTVEFLEPHSAFFTFAENLGNPDCLVPVDDRFTFHPTRQPVVIDLWRPFGAESGPAFTTIGNWRQAWREVRLDGRVYRWSKDEEFRRFLDLPDRVEQGFELALANCPEPDKATLTSHGWKVRDALSVSTDPDVYRRYIGASRGEFTVAKDQNVRLRSGWFSDRSATYLAAGKPVVTQETGFSNVLPTGEGLFAFSDMDDIVSAIDAVNTDYERHRRAAADLAAEHFAATAVLSRLLDTAGVDPARRPSTGTSKTEVEPLPEDLVLTPVSRWPTTLPQETVDAVLARPVPQGRSVRVAPAATSIVVATFDNLVFTRMCLESLLAHTAKADVEVIVVDNGSRDGTPEYLRALARRDTRVKPLLNDRNLGFAAAANQGLQEAEGDTLLLLNNDTLVPPGWLARLTAHLGDPVVGMVGPMTNRSRSESEVATAYTTYGGFLRFARERQAQPRTDLVDVSALVMFCVAFRREVFERVGPLDERFEIGMFEDDDYAMRLRASGYRLACAPDAFVHHFGQASIGKLAATGTYGPLFHENRTRFEEKWGVSWESHRRRTDPAYDDLVRRTRTLVGRSLPAHARVLVISNGDDRLVDLSGRTGSHFPQDEAGVYAGHHPADSATAIEELESLRESGQEFLLVPETARWWFDHYAKFAEHLEANYRVVAEDHETATIFALTPEVAVARSGGGEVGA